eukprot:scaffold24587_cov59-Phaeocystis_antarctica.AAC.3
MAPNNSADSASAGLSPHQRRARWPLPCRAVRQRAPQLTRPIQPDASALAQLLLRAVSSRPRPQRRPGGGGRSRYHTATRRAANPPVHWPVC